MMNPNEKPSLAFPVKAAIAPQSVGAAATVTSGWVAAGANKWAKVLSVTGAGAGTFAVKIEQATSVGGAGAKDLVTAAVLGITAQLNSTQAQADVSIDGNIDVDNAYAFIRLSSTCTGGAGTFQSVSLELGPGLYTA